MFLVKKIKKEPSGITGSRILLTNIEIKDIVKVINSLENRRTLLNGTIRKIIIQEGRLLNLLDTLTRTGLSLIKNMLTSLVKTVFPALGVTVAASAVDAAIQKNI